MVTIASPDTPGGLEEVCKPCIFRLANKDVYVQMHEPNFMTIYFCLTLNFNIAAIFKTQKS